MTVLAHIHTLNDADIIDRTIGSLMHQTRPIDGLLLVDNASTDDTLGRPSTEHAISETIGPIMASHSLALGLPSSDHSRRNAITLVTSVFGPDVSTAYPPYAGLGCPTRIMYWIGVNSNTAID